MLIQEHVETLGEIRFCLYDQAWDRPPWANYSIQDLSETISSFLVPDYHECDL